jgi:hypothetical protein
VARILVQAGFFIGAYRNEAEDSKPIMGFFERWLRPYVASGCTLGDDAKRLAAEDFRLAVADHRRGIKRADQAWAVKVPRSLLMLSYWRQAFPEIRFIHVIRNGLDMAYSSDNYQLLMFQDLVLPTADRELPLPLRAMAYWRNVNLQAAGIGESFLGARYHLVRFEDLCRMPQSVIAKLAAFVDAPIDIAAAAAQVSAPTSIGRWRAHPMAEIDSLLAIGKPALERFGYWSSSVDASSR